MRMKNRQARFAQAVGAISAFLATVAMTASASIVVINENFDIDDPVGGDPVNGCCPGTWIPNQFVAADVPGHSGPDVNFQPQVISDGGNGVGEYVEGRGGGPEYDLDGYLLADQAATGPGTVVAGNFNFRLVGGEGLIGLANNTQAMADGTNNGDANFSFAPSPDSAILWGLFFGEGFGASGGDTLASYSNGGGRIPISTAQGVGFPAAESIGRVRFDFQYTVGSSVFDSLTITTVGGGAFNNTPLVREDDGTAVPVTNPGGFDGWFQGNYRANGAFNANYNTDDIYITIPEPSTIGLLALGALAVAARRRTH